MSKNNQSAALHKIWKYFFSHFYLYHIQKPPSSLSTSIYVASDSMFMCAKQESRQAGKQAGVRDEEIKVEDT